MKDASSLTDPELGQLLKTLAGEEKTRSEKRNKELNDKNTEQVEFLTKCRNLAHSVLPNPVEVDTDKPLKSAYQLFESMVSTLQAHIQETKEEQKEETSWLLMAQHTAFFEAYKVLQDHMEESIVTEEILREWPNYYGKVYQQTRQNRQGI